METNKNHDTLMGASWNDLEGIGDKGQNQRLLGADKILSDNNKKLNNAIVVGYEAEVVAKDTKINLQGDSEKMVKMGDKLHRIDVDVGSSDKLVDIIKWNEQKNSIILYGTIWILVSWVLAVFIYKFERNYLNN